MRDTPFSRKIAIASRVDADPSTVTMSVRGTMTARTNVSVKSNTEWMSSRSSSSISSFSAASSMMLSSCSSEANDDPRATPGVTRLPSATRPCASGPRKMRTPRMTGAAPRSRPFACWRPTVRGLAPTTTNEIPVIRTAAASMAHQMLSNRIVNATVTSTAAAVSARMRMNTTALACASGSMAILRSDAALRPLEPRSARSAREVTPSAASIAAMRPPNAISRTAATRSSAAVMRGVVVARRRGSS